jgi:hypothetical protein
MGGFLFVEKQRMADEKELMQEDQDRAAMEAAFAASDEAESAPSIEPPKQEEAPVEETKQEEVKDHEVQEPIEEKPVATPALTEDQLRLLSAIPELEKRLTQQVDKVAGNYGEVKRLIGEMQKAAATPRGASEFSASEDMTQFEQDFAEIANPVKQMIEQRLASLNQGISADQLEAYIASRETDQRNRAVQALDEMHPDRLEIIQTKEWGDWLGSLPKYRQAAIANSQDLHYVAGEIGAFKDHRQAQIELAQKQAQQDAKSKSRVEKAVTPSGSRQSTQSTISEEDAMRKAFAEADNL